MKAPVLVPLLAAGIVLLGCADTPTEPEPMPPAAGFDFLNGPEMPGVSFVMRFSANDTWQLGTQSVEDQLFTIYGGAAEISYCGGAGAPEYSVQWNDLETALNIVALKKKFTIYVYEFFDEYPPDFCGYLATNWAYHGTATYNEVSHESLANGNVSWKWTMNGMVEDQSGNPYTYHETQHYVRDANGNGGWITESIKVRPQGGS